MKYKIYQEENLYLIKDAYDEVVASCTNEKTAKYLLSLLNPVNDNRCGLDSPLANKVKEILKNEKCN